MALPRRLRSPIFAAELCPRSLSGSDAPKFPQKSHFLCLLLRSRRWLGLVSQTQSRNNAIKATAEGCRHALYSDILILRRPFSDQKPPNGIMFLVFFFLIAQGPEKNSCRRGGRTFVAGTVGA